MIAPKLHFIFGLWDTGPMPRPFAVNRDAWQRALPELSVKVWDRFHCDQILKKYQALGWILGLRPVQQADLLRLLVVYDEGGWYSDLDTSPSPGAARTWQACAGQELVVLIETICDADATHASRRFRYREGVPEHPLRIANYSFAAAPRHPFLWQCLELAQERCQAWPGGTDDYYPIFTTGPDVLTMVYHGAKPGSSSLLPASDWCRHAEAGTWRNNRA